MHYGEGRVHKVSELWKGAELSHAQSLAEREGEKTWGFTVCLISSRLAGLILLREAQAYHMTVTSLPQFIYSSSVKQTVFSTGHCLESGHAFPTLYNRGLSLAKASLLPPAPALALGYCVSLSLCTIWVSLTLHSICLPAKSSVTSPFHHWANQRAEECDLRIIWVSMGRKHCSGECTNCAFTIHYPKMKGSKYDLHYKAINLNLHGSYREAHIKTRADSYFKSYHYIKNQTIFHYLMLLFIPRKFPLPKKISTTTFPALLAICLNCRLWNTNFYIDVEILFLIQLKFNVKLPSVVFILFSPFRVCLGEDSWCSVSGNCNGFPRWSFLASPESLGWSMDT